MEPADYSLRKASLHRDKGDNEADAAAGQCMTAEPSDNVAAWLQEVMDRHEGPLLRYAERILGDADRGRDVVQETFMRLLESDRSFEGGHLVQWLFTVCRNRCLDICRKERRMTLMSDHTERTRPGSEPAPDTVASGREQAGRVTAAMSALPTNQREVLRLRFQNGLSYKQIAGVTGLSASNVGFLIHTGIQRLRKRFGVGSRPGRDGEMQ